MRSSRQKSPTFQSQAAQISPELLAYLHTDAEIRTTLLSECHDSLAFEHQWAHYDSVLQYCLSYMVWPKQYYSTKTETKFVVPSPPYFFFCYFGKGLKGKKPLASFPCEPKRRSTDLDIVPMQRNSYVPIKSFGTFEVMNGWEMLSLLQSTCSRSFGQLVKRKGYLNM